MVPFFYRVIRDCEVSRAIRCHTPGPQESKGLTPPYFIFMFPRKQSTAS